MGIPPIRLRLLALTLARADPERSEPGRRPNHFLVRPPHPNEGKRTAEALLCGRATLMAIQRYEPRIWRVMTSASLACLVDRFTGCPIPRFRRQATRSHDSDDRETNGVSRFESSAIQGVSHAFQCRFLFVEKRDCECGPRYHV